MGNIYINIFTNAPNDEKLIDVDLTFGLHYGFGLYIKILLLMCEADNHMLMQCKCNAYAMRLHMPQHELIEYLEHCVKIKLLEKDKVSYYSTRFLDDMAKVDKIKTDNKEKAMKRWHPEPTPEPVKLEKPKKPTAKPCPDITETPEIQGLKILVTSIIAPYLQSKEGKASNHKSTLTNQNYADLIGIYGVSKLKKMLRVYYEWKMSTARVIKDDNLAIRKAWVEEKADNPNAKQPTNANYVQPLKEKAGF
jgi:hypothetical protein